MGILVEACGVCKSYKHGNLNTDVLRHVDMNVLAGEMVSIVGPSGSGKSTLLHCLAGLEVPDVGEIHLMGVDVVRARRGERAKVRAQHVGFVFQQYNLMPSLSVGENVSLPARFAGRRVSGKDVCDLLERVGMGGWFASFSATAAADPMVSTSFFFRSAAQAILMFSAISGCVVLSSTARGIVVSLRRTYALWQVINIPPVVVGFAVIVQIALVGVFGSCLGLSLCWASSSTVFSALFMDIDLFEGVRLLPGFSLCPAVLGVSLFLSVLGGARAARAAACTPPVMALRDEWSVEGASERMMPLRWLAALAACAAAAWCVSTVDPVLAPVDFGQSTWLVFLPIAIPALITALAPVLLPRILRAATCPLSRWTAWLLARRSAQHALTQSLSIETSLVVAMGVVAGFYSMMSLMERYATAYDLPIGSGFGLDPRLACVMFAGPVILAAVGSCTNVVLALRVRGRDASLLEVLGATPRQVCVVSVLEAYMHVVTAGSAALLAVVLSNMIAAHALGLGAGSAMLSVRFAPAVLIAVAGFVVLVVAGLMPVLRMIRTAPVRFLNE